jgi:RimJ/RimL family protein N-acetyltransferase
VYGPVIEGSQFRLRPPRPEDAEVMVTWFQDQEVTAWLAIRLPMTLEAERAWLQHVGEDRNIVLWAIEHEQRVVGTTGIAQIDWTNQHGTTGTLIGDKTVWGKGIAREMMRLRAEFAFTQLPLGKLKSAYIAGNEASRRAQEGAGYRAVGRWRRERFSGGQWLDMILTELLREDWEQARQPQARQTGGETYGGHQDAAAVEHGDRGSG